MPKLGFDHSWSEWEATGKEDIRSKAKEAVKEILSKDHFEPLPAETEKEINVIIEKAYQELVVR